jgi:4-amino-4-deoxy-L-arabinose transferase-like glycosyltransferase
VTSLQLSLLAARRTVLLIAAGASGESRFWLSWIGLASVLAGGAALRFWNLTAGLPYRIGVDEPVIAGRAIQIMKSGDFHPHFFDYAGFYIYVQVLVGCVRFLVGAADGLWRSLDQFWPEHLFLWTRALNAALGTATILVVYRAGLRWGRWVALLAAGLLAVWPNHVRESHFALTDVPLTFLTTLALVLSLRAYETGRLAWFLAAGASVGLAGATKYNGAIALIMPFVAAAMAKEPRSSRVRSAVAATGAAAGAFLIAAPYTLLDLPAFLDAFGVLGHAYRPRPFSSGAAIYIGHLEVALGWVGVIVAGAGIVWGMARGIRDRDVGKWAVVAAFPLIYFQMVATKNIVYGRYLLPILPFLCLSVAFVVVDVVAWIVRLKQPMWVRSIAAAAFAGVALAPVVSKGIVWPKEYGKRTTQDAAYDVIRLAVPNGSRVAIEHAVLRLPDSAYRTMYVDNLTDRSPEEYVSSGVRFLIASSDGFDPAFARPDQHPDAYQAYRRLLDEAAQCLPTIEPTAAVSGPAIRICRLWTH